MYFNTQQTAPFVQTDTYGHFTLLCSLSPYPPHFRGLAKFVPVNIRKLLQRAFVSSLTFALQVDNTVLSTCSSVPTCVQ
jgi:hypothetical protein